MITILLIIVGILLCWVWGKYDNIEKRENDLKLIIERQHQLIDEQLLELEILTETLQNVYNTIKEKQNVYEMTDKDVNEIISWKEITKDI